jgi:hypothetical protein
LCGRSEILGNSPHEPLARVPLRAGDDNQTLPPVVHDRIPSPSPVPHHPPVRVHCGQGQGVVAEAGVDCGDSSG